MVQCKEDVFTWFKELSGAKRIELMCGLLNLCIPLEWRFFATVIENLARRDYSSLKEAEIKSNSPQEFEAICSCNWLLAENAAEEQLARNGASNASQTPAVSSPQPSNSMDKHLSSVRSKIVVYLCLLQSSNRCCATIAYKAFIKQLSVENLSQTLATGKKSAVEKADLSIEKTHSNTPAVATAVPRLEAGFSNLGVDNMFYNEIILLHTLAIHHPAFTFEQQTVLIQQLNMVQQWMDAVTFATAHRNLKMTDPSAYLSNPAFVQFHHYQQQAQQFHHPFQTTNKQQHPQYHQLQQQQYNSHLQQIHEFNELLANSISNSSLPVPPQHGPESVATLTPALPNQLMSAVDPSVAVCGEMKLVPNVKDDLIENEEISRSNKKETRSSGVVDRAEKELSLVINGDVGENKKSNFDHSKPDSPLGSFCSSDSSSPVSSASTSVNGAIVSQQSMSVNSQIENILKKESLRKYKDKIVNIKLEELRNMSEEDFMKLGLANPAAARLKKALATNTCNGLRFETPVEKMEKSGKKTISVSPLVNVSSDRETDEIEFDERLSIYPKSSSQETNTAAIKTSTSSNQKWPLVHKTSPNAAVTSSSVLPGTNRPQAASKATTSSSSWGNESSVQPVAKVMQKCDNSSSSAATSALNRVPWKSAPTIDNINNTTVKKCVSCTCTCTCTCSGSNGSSTATTPSSTPPPNIPGQTLPSGMIPLASGQPVINPYWLLLPPPSLHSSSAVNGYVSGSQTEQFFNYWYTLAMAAASAPYWSHFPPTSIGFSGSIPNFSSAAAVLGGNQSLFSTGNFQSAKSTSISCYNCGGVGHRGNECTLQSLDDVVKPSTFNMNFNTPSEFDSHATSHTLHHSTQPSQASHLHAHPHQPSYHYSTSPSHNFQDGSDRSAPRHGTSHGQHPHT